MSRTADARLDLTVQRALDAVNRPLAPRAPALRRWARAALLKGEAEVTIRLVGEAEGRRLNRDYRGKDYATNVLTFVYGDDVALSGMPLFGDIVLCVPVLVREAEQQGKVLEAHFAHLVVHGMLHLQGFDHEQPLQAQEMEALESSILSTFGHADPYV